MACVTRVKLAGKMFSRFITTSIQGPQNFIGGSRVESQDGTETIRVSEPATGEKLCEIKSSGEKDISAAVESATVAFDQWSALSGAERGRVLLKTAQHIRERIDDIATLEVKDCGKPIWEARADIAACADAFEYYGGVAGSIHGSHVPLAAQNFAIIQREPLGVCAGIGAWNFPFLIASWKAAPALACGNTMIFKPSQFTPLTAVALAEILTDSGLPAGGYNVVQGGASTGQLICENPKIAKVSFTGSVPTGVKIMSSCARQIKQVTLELGGKSPLIVFDDCNLENAVKATMMGNFLSQGQVCSNATRVYVHTNIQKQFLDKLVSYTKKMKLGNPFDDDVKVGATISQEHAEKILNYVQSAKDQGASILCGGERIKMSADLAGGFYLSPCVISNCTDSMTVVKEEIFGAVVSVLSFENEKEVVARANDSPFGLAAGVFTQDITRAHRVAKQLQSGIVWINNYNLYPPEVPFGGYKMSGMGRENGMAVIDHYTQLKTIMIEMNDVECPLI